MAVSQKLTLKETSVDTLANSSKVKIVWTSTQTGDSHNDNTRTAKYWITINGKKTEYTVSYTLPEDTTKTILSRTITVPHRDDGTGTVKVETWMDTRISAGEVELSKSLTLTTIARASTIGATNAYIESTSIIGINRKSDAYTHSVAFSFEDLVGYIDDAGNITDVEVKHTGSSIPFLITPLFYDYIPDKPSGTCNLVCRTYRGDTFIGSKSAKFTIRADPELCRPVISCEVKDVNPKTIELTGDPDTLVRYASTARCTVSAEPRNGASISSVKVNGNNTTGTFDIFNPATGDFVFAAEDSRGFVTEEPVTKNLIPYIPTTLNSKVTRTDPTSGNGIFEVSGQCYAKSFGAAFNEISATYSINNAIAKTATVQISEDGLRYTVSEEISGLYYMSTSSVTVTLSDAFGKKTQTVTVKPGVPVFDWGEHDFTFHVPVSMSGHGISNLAKPVNDADAVNKTYADSKISIAKVWTNGSPSVAFAEQTLDIPFETNEMAIVFFADGTDARAQSFILAEYGHTSRAIGRYASRLTLRGVKVQSDGLYIEGGSRMTTYGEWSNSNEVMIPMSVYKLCGVTDTADAADVHATCGEFLCGEVVAGQ